MKTPYRERLPDVPAPPAFPREPGAAGGRAEVVSYGDDRRTRGRRTLTALSGEAGARSVEDLRDVAPDLADWIVDFAYGDVLARPGLDYRTRQLAIIAALASSGHAQPQLRAHLEGALKVGCRPQEIIEVILQTAVYAGFPAAVNALEVARDVLARGR